jgi:HEAT repeat protein
MKVSEIPDHLLKALQAEDSGPLDAIIRAQRPADLEVLRRIVASDDLPEELRRKAIYALGRWGDVRSVEEIERALPALGEGARIAAIDALGRLGTEQALQTVARFRDDPSPHVRKFVVKALSQSGSAEARVGLREIAEKDPEEWVRNLAREKEKQ